MGNHRARELRRNLSDAEQHLWDSLRRRQMAGCKFRRQTPIGLYIVDFICYEERLIVEVDGGQHAEQVAYDRKRDAWLKQQGYTVLRFWNNEVLENAQGVLETIAGYLSPSPPP
jgi:very-short-patch-repair endonuclease